MLKAAESAGRFAATRGDTATNCPYTATDPRQRSLVLAWVRGWQSAGTIPVTEAGDPVTAAFVPEQAHYFSCVDQSHLYTCMPPGDDHAPHPGPCKGWKRKPKAGDPAKDAPKSAPKSRKPAAGSKAERDQIARQLIIRMAAGERFDIKPDGVPDLMAALSAADAPPINLAQLHISGPGNENLFDRPLRDIPRENMPALPDNVPGLVPFIQGLSRMRDKNGNPIRVELVEIDPREIQATQSELSGPKVAKMAGFMKSGWKPGGAAIVSGENALLDGHHRWAGASVAALMYDQGVEGYSPVKMQVLRVDLPIDELLQIAEQFSGPKKGLGEKP